MNQKWEYFCSRQPQLPLIKSKVLLTTNMAIHQTLSLGFCPPSALISTFDSDVWSKIGPKLSHICLKRNLSIDQYNDESTSLNTQTSLKWNDNAKMSNKNLNFIPVEHFQSLNIRISWEPDMNSALWGK